jgi:hypothetical protein
MAETSDVGLLPRTYFKMPRVPFDFRAVALAVVGLLVYEAGGWLISKIGTDNRLDIPGAFLAWFVELFDGFPILGARGGLLYDFFNTTLGIDEGKADTIHHVVGGIWFFAVWSFVGLAIRRIVSLRIARDEGLSLREAVGFAVRNWFTVLLAPAIIAVAAGLFWLCNLLAGLAMSIPFAGSVFAIIFVPLTVLSTLLLILIALGGLFGFPLVGAAAAWERNGSLDAISRAFTYVFASPLQYFLNFFLILVFTGIIVYVGNCFVLALTRSVDSGVVSDRLSVAIDAPAQTGVASADDDWARLSDDAKKDAATYREKTGFTGRATLEGRGVRARREAKDVPLPFAMDFDTVVHAPISHKVSIFMFWLFLKLIVLGVAAYAIFWFLGASSCLYADLRADVDGTEEDEIHTDEDDLPQAATEGALPPGVPAGTPTPPPSEPPPPPPA